MSLLRNPWVVGCLALFAVGLVAHNVVWPIVKRSLPAKTNTRVSETAAPASPAPPPASSTFNTESGPDSPPPRVSDDAAVSRIDRDLVLAGADRWMETPRRDPFHNLFQQKSRAKELLTLAAVWRQSGSTLAVINNKLLAEGDTILDFKVQKIGEDRVWVEGPDGRQSVEFKLPVPPAAHSPTNEFKLTDQASPNP